MCTIWCSEYGGWCSDITYSPHPVCTSTIWWIMSLYIVWYGPSHQPPAGTQHLQKQPKIGSEKEGYFGRPKRWFLINHCLESGGVYLGPGITPSTMMWVVVSLVVVSSGLVWTHSNTVYSVYSCNTGVVVVASSWWWYVYLVYYTCYITTYSVIACSTVSEWCGVDFIMMWSHPTLSTHILLVSSSVCPLHHLYRAIHTYHLMGSVITQHHGYPVFYAVGCEWIP